MTPDRRELPPLSLAAAWRDRHSDSMARAGLIEHYAHLVAATVSRAGVLPLGWELGDAEGLGYLALIRAADAYDAGRGVAFETYAIGRIRWALLEARREELRRRLPLVWIEASADAKDLAERIPDDRPAPDSRMIGRCAWREALARLTARQRRVFSLYYLAEESADQIAGELGITTACVHSLLSLARRRLRNPCRFPVAGPIMQCVNGRRRPTS